MRNSEHSPESADFEVVFIEFAPVLFFSVNSSVIESVFVKTCDSTPIPLGSELDDSTEAEIRKKLDVGAKIREFGVE